MGGWVGTASKPWLMGNGGWIWPEMENGVWWIWLENEMGENGKGWLVLGNGGWIVNWWRWSIVVGEGELRMGWLACLVVGRCWW